MSMIGQFGVQSATLRRISYAQNMEDILLDRLFGDEVGSFVDLGAHHPFLDNNTFFFYERGWKGVNIEPLPHLHRLLMQHRPRDFNLAVAVSDVEGILPFCELPQCSGLSTLSTEIADRYRHQGFQVLEGQVRTRTMGSLISEYRIAPPDILSVDVEGHEHQVLRGMPLASWRPKVIVIESTLPRTKTTSHHDWEPALLNQGFVFAVFNGINRFYLRDDWADKSDLLQVPANALDNYERIGTVLLENRIRELENRIKELESRMAPR